MNTHTLLLLPAMLLLAAASASADAESPASESDGTASETTPEQEGSSETDSELLERADELGDAIQTTTASSSAGASYGVAEAIVTAPMDAVMGAVTGYGSYEDFMPNFRSSRVLSQRGSNAVVYLEASALRGALTVWAEMRMYSRPSDGETEVIEGRMRDGNLEHFVARWEVTPVDDGRTLVRFRVLFVPNLPFPDSVVTGENVAAARKTVRNLRNYLADS